MEELTPGDPVTVITRMDRAIINDEVHFVYATGNGQARSGTYLYVQEEGVRWCRGWDGPAVDALIAAEALR